MIIYKPTCDLLHGMSDKEVVAERVDMFNFLISESGKSFRIYLASFNSEAVHLSVVLEKACKNICAAFIISFSNISR